MTVRAAQAMLSIGAALLGAGCVTGVDVDSDALAVAAENVARFSEEDGDDEGDEEGKLEEEEREEKEEEEEAGASDEEGAGARHEGGDDVAKSRRDATAEATARGGGAGAAAVGPAPPPPRRHMGRRLPVSCACLCGPLRPRSAAQRSRLGSSRATGVTGRCWAAPADRPRSCGRAQPAASLPRRRLQLARVRHAPPAGGHGAHEPALWDQDQGECRPAALPCSPRRRAATCTAAVPQLRAHLSARQGADALFLRAAFAASCGSVYSLHKSSTRDFVQRLATR